MHGIVFVELKKYVSEKLGEETWQKLLTEAGYEGAWFIPTQTYPDEQAVKLVVTASAMTGKSAGAILEDFGEFIAPDLMAMYKSFVKADWKALDLLEHTEKVIHNVVRMRNPGARPAELKTKRISPTELELIYGSDRKMCALAKGIIRGVGVHYHQKLAIDETACMNNGASACTFRVRA